MSMFEQRMCDECGKKPAVYYMKNVINGVTTEKYLCDDCKKKFGFTKSAFPDFGSLFASFANPFAGLDAPRAAKCPTCGYTSGEYLETGFLGCPDCYNAFSEIIVPSISKVQKDVRHVGKSPKEFYSPEEAKYNELMLAREEAVAKEDFKLAAQINDQMKKLKGGA